MTQSQAQYVEALRWRSKNGIAVAGMVLGVVAVAIGYFSVQGGSLVFYAAALPSLLAIIFGIAGLVVASRNNGVRRAVAGWALVLGILGVWVGSFLGGLLVG